MTIKYAEAFLTGVLACFGMDTDYTSAKKDTLRTRDGEDVLDLVGGWGSTLLGHNHPEIVECAKALLDSDAPIHAQFSLHPVADQVGARLNAVIAREFPGAEPYSVIFANSGAEAVEAAAKHGELDRAMRAAALLDEIAWNVAEAERAVREGRAEAADALLERVAEHNAAASAKPPVFFALERAFHGKLIGSTQFTYNPAFRGPFAALGLPARFVPPNDAAALQKAAAEERVAVLDVAVVDGAVVAVERDFPIFGGILVEPIQGEGGIHPLTPEYAAALRGVADDLGCPLIADEIQTGMGRTGRFFASAHIGLTADIFLLGKSLGGGIGKVSAMLVRQSHYRPEFELVHSSTFAKDGFSTAITLKALDVLEGDDAYARAVERGERITGVLRELAEEYPDVIADIRGRGLLIGLEFADQSGSASAVIREKNASGLLSFLLAGYLQLAHRIRTGPTASAPNMLRIEPSIYLTDEEIDQIRTGFGALCAILRHEDGAALVHPLTWPAPGSRCVTTDQRARKAVQTGKTGPVDRKVGYLGYLLTPDTLRAIDPTLARLDDERILGYVKRTELLKDLLPLDPVRVESPSGAAVELVVYPLVLTPEQLPGAAADVERRVRAATADGCEVIGLGHGLGPATAHGGALRVPGIAVTTGNALAAYSALTALEPAAAERFGGTEQLELAIVGGGGRVGAAAAELAAPHVRKITLIGRSAEQLRAAELRIYQTAWEIIAGGGEKAGLVAALAEEPLIRQWLLDGRPSRAASGAEIAEALRQTYADNPFVSTSISLSAVRDARLVLSVAPVPGAFLAGQHVRDDAIVCDLANPGVEHDSRQVRGGILRTPGAASLPLGAWGTGGEGELSACAAEAVVWGLANPGADPTADRLTSSRDRALAELAKEHGFQPLTT